MVTQSRARRAPANTTSGISRKKVASGIKENLYSWSGKDRSGKTVRGEVRATGEAVIKASLNRQGIKNVKVKKLQLAHGKKITEKDIALFTRQLATMMRAGVPLLQAFDIGAKGASNASLGRLLNYIRADVEAGASLATAFRRHPRYFDKLYCNLVAAGEQAGILDNLLDRLATYREKMLGIKTKVKSAMTYPIVVIIVSILVIAALMIFVIPTFKDMFEGFGAELPAPTQLVVAISDGLVAHWWWIGLVIITTFVALKLIYPTSQKLQNLSDRLKLGAPIIGPIVRKGTIARWTRTLSTMFAAGVPLVEALDSVGSAAGSIQYQNATQKIQSEVSSGTSLTVAMTNSNVFPTMITQMVSIGEESGQLDAMLGKVSDFLDEEVDAAVGSLTQILEPIIIVVLGVLIGFILVAMYLPIFQMAGSV